MGKGVRPEMAPFTEGGSGPSGVNEPAIVGGTEKDGGLDLDLET